MARTILPGLGLGLLTALAAVSAVFIRMVGPRPLPVLATLPDFSLTERSGKRLQRSDLRGRLWLADFIFTSCAGTCPVMSAQMRELHRTLRPERLRFVSFTVDPKNDTVEVLRGYALGWRADHRWLFATGDKETLHRLAREGFKLAVFETPSDDGPFTHSEKFALVDARGRVRGYFSGTDPGAYRQVTGAVRRLVRELHTWPTLNAALNGVSAGWLLLGWLAIRRRWIAVHRTCMIAAFTTSMAFLVSYLAYHAQPGQLVTRFPDVGTARTFYLALLGSHTLLAAVVPPLALVTFARAARGQFDRHRALARWTLPIWLYVSVTGVAVYLMLYVLFADRIG